MDTTKTILLSVLLLAAGTASAQELPTNDALQAAIALAELQHDDAAARDAIVAIAEDPAVPMDVKRHAWLWFARLSRRMGDEKAARIVLERAARGDDELARRAQQMLAQEPQDPRREAELRERAEVAFRSYKSNPSDARAIRDLQWFGDHAARILVREYESTGGQWGDWGIRHALWRLDSAVARTFLTEKLASDDVEARQRITASVPPTSDMPDTTFALARRALLDDDALVVVNVLRAGDLLEVDDLAPLISDDRVEVRLAALQRLQQNTQRTFAGTEFNDPQRRIEARRIVAHLRMPLQATDPQEFRLAATMLCRVATLCAEGRALLIAYLARLGDDATELRWPEDPELATPDENAAGIAALIKELGPMPGRSTATAAQRCLRSLIGGYVYDGWDRTASGTVLAAARAEYVYLDGEWLDRHADDADAMKFAALLPATRERGGILGWLSRRDLAPDLFPILRRSFDDLVAHGSRPHNDELAMLLTAIGRTGHPDAAPFLLDSVTRLGDGADPAFSGLVAAGRRRNDAATRDVLRTALLAIEPGRFGFAASRLLGRLVRMGDVAVFADPDALDARCLQSRVACSDLDDDVRFAALGVGGMLACWLTARVQDGGQTIYWHGYDAVGLATVWTGLLSPRTGSSRRWAQDWDVLADLLNDVPACATELPREVVLALCGAFATRISSEGGNWPPPLLDALDRLRSVETRVHWRNDAELVAALGELSDAMWIAPSDFVRVRAATASRGIVDDVVAGRLVGLLGDRSLAVARCAWNALHEDAGLPIDAAMVGNGLTSTNPEVRLLAVEHAASTADLAEVVRPTLRDPSPDVRAAACQALGATLSLDVVPDLLESLRDSASHVRTAATDALQAIRFYHDEKAHWDRVFAGEAGLTATSAAEALLRQAAPANDSATRVLAIRSLGVLAAPETLPFLIEWTKDADAEVATAARAAIQRIHTTGR
ncbi:MAG: HEAT repeat domain-containing protein [Planctomycetes bacterium]|nr:HEAT repeat domain-containing protein [Planctomycetota bacterium]